MEGQIQRFKRIGYERFLGYCIKNTGNNREQIRDFLVENTKGDTVDSKEDSISWAIEKICTEHKGDWVLFWDEQEFINGFQVKPLDFFTDENFKKLFKAELQTSKN